MLMKPEEEKGLGGVGKADKSSANEGKPEKIDVPT